MRGLGVAISSSGAGGLDIVFWEELRRPGDLEELPGHLGLGKSPRLILLVFHLGPSFLSRG